MLQAIQPTDLVQHMTQSPAKGWSRPYECINPSYYDLLRQATITDIFFQGRAKIQRYSSSTKILSLCCHRGPDSRVLLLALQKAPGWKGQPSVGCPFSPSVLQRKGTRRETTSLPVSSECHRGWQVLGSLSFKWREGKVFTEPMCISSYSNERSISCQHWAKV